MAEDTKTLSKALTESGISSVSEKELGQLEQWKSLKPELRLIDFRPYIFVSSEKAIEIKSSDELPHALRPLFDVLATGVRLSMTAKGADINALSESQSNLIFNELASLCKSSSDWSKAEGPIAGAIYLVSQKAHLEAKLIELLELIPSKALKPWTVSNLSGFKSNEGLIARNEFLQKIESSTETPRTVKTLAQQSKTV